MLRLSKKLVCALEAVVDVAYNSGVDPVQSREITTRQGIPERYLEQVLQQMVRANILKGVRGPRGGYRLARERRRITVGEIARVVYAGEDELLDPAIAQSTLGRDVIQPFWDEFRQIVMTQLDSVTVEDLCRRARDAGVGGKDDASTDFSI